MVSNSIPLRGWGFIDGFFGEFEDIFEPVFFAVLIKLCGVLDFGEVPPEAGCLFDGNRLCCVDGVGYALEEIKEAIHGLPQIEPILNQRLFWYCKELLNCHSGIPSFKKLDGFLKLWVCIKLLA